MVFALFFGFSGLYGSSYITREGSVRFFSSAPLEDIEALNNRVRAVMDIETGEVAVMMRIVDFQFSKALMQRHFNENYMESHIFPEARFAGNLKGLPESPSGNTGNGASGEITVTGSMTIHGVTRDVEITGSVERDGSHYLFNAVFPVRVEDYGIRVPRMVMRNIAEIVEVTVNLRLIPVN